MAGSPRLRINVVHAVPEVAQAFGKDHDGFTAAMEVLAERHEVKWLNVHPYNSDAAVQAALIADADFVLVRSDWGWFPCAAADDALRGRADVAVGLLIAGSHPPPSAAETMRFDVLFYETPWYAQFVDQHPFAVEAFGVDTRHMYPGGGQRDIDWLMVGRLAVFKRPERLIPKKGRRVAVGDLSSAPSRMKSALEDSGVEVVDFMPYAGLANYYRRSRTVLVACKLQGGGERSVLEGRACGCKVEVAHDNPKLQSLLDIPVSDHTDYASRLEGSILEVLEGRRPDAAAKLRGQRAARRARVRGKVMRAPRTILIRTQHAISTFRRRGMGN